VRLGAFARRPHVVQGTRALAKGNDPNKKAALWRPGILKQVREAKKESADSLG